jgi:hypothetical protein
MASKKTTAGNRPGKCKTRTELKKLLTKAQAQVANLHQRAGTLAQKDLKARLKEVKGHLRAMEPFDWYTKH